MLFIHFPLLCFPLCVHVSVSVCVALQGFVTYVITGEGVCEVKNCPKLTLRSSGHTCIMGDANMSLDDFSADSHTRMHSLPHIL